VVINGVMKTAVAFANKNAIEKKHAVCSQMMDLDRCEVAEIPLNDTQGHTKIILTDRSHTVS